MKKIIIFTLMMLMTIAASAAPDKKKVKQLKVDMDNARTAIKKQSNLEGSENTLRKYIADEDFAGNSEIHLLLFEVLHKEYQVMNEKMYLKQKVDTASIVRTARRLFVAAEQLDSIDALSDKASYRKRNASLLLPYVDNLFKGGQYFYAHKLWNDCYETLSTYLSLKNKPLFEGCNISVSNDPHASFLAMSSAVQMNDLPKALRYSSMAVQFMPRREVALQMIAEVCREKKDSVHYVSYLIQGYTFYPESEYFFPHLIDYYAERSDYDSALRFAEDALAKDSSNVLFLLARHSMLMQKKEYDAALQCGLQLLAKDDAMVMPNYNVGYIYYLRAQEAMRKPGIPYRQRLRDAQKQYKLCMPYIEKYRKAREDDKMRWRPILYDVYLNLNMGKEFAEIEKL